MMNNDKIHHMKVASVYPLYIAKAERKGRTAAEVDQIILWLTGHDDNSFRAALEDDVDFAQFFTDAPALNPIRKQITGVICGVRVEDIVDPITQEVRYLDKLIDELAKGKSMDKILRT